MHISQIDSVDLFSPFFIYLVQWTIIIFQILVKAFSLNIHVKTLMTHEASLRRSFMTNRYCEVPNFPGCQGPALIGPLYVLYQTRHFREIVCIHILET